MRILPIPVLSDNYSYLIIDDANKIAAVVDPAEPEKVIKAAEKEGVTIQMVLTTHHHWDHAGGNEQFKKLQPQSKIIGGDDRIACLDQKVTEGTILQIGGLKIEVLFTPCHTTGHVLYFVKDETTVATQQQPPALFSGDTLFIAGCGRFFEGTAEQMFKALCVSIARLPTETHVYCGHEYTVKNLEFVLHVDPENQAAQQKFEWAKQCRSKNEFTIPSTLAEELTYNPFMRVNQPKFLEKMGYDDPIKLMSYLRKRKILFNKKNK